MMLREEIRTLIERNSLSQVIDSLSCTVLDMADEAKLKGDAKALEQIGRELIVSKGRARAQGY